MLGRPTGCDVGDSIWAAATALRRSGELLCGLLQRGSAERRRGRSSTRLLARPAARSGDGLLRRKLRRPAPRLGFPDRLAG